ncbi:acyltransferase family protein [Pseudomonas sp. NPDC089734]|uniref:acyltransferase family protein n=1 Tax=Pseudomonas sp. NPDC089734 TaxID=3364469 RepID=UPI00382AC309
MKSSAAQPERIVKYRPEIDGLRSLAVLPVILFHAGFTFFSGGFVGVDIFFVISGYLITSILATEITQGNFSILSFYERRARRILPALFFVIIATLPFALVWMLDSDIQNLGRSIMSVAVFASNLFFWRNTDYFDPAATEQPLLHTWSLAVEEQYYIFFPLFLILAWKLRRTGLTLLLLCITCVSLALAEWAATYHPAVNFYLLPTRAWELLAGSLVAMLMFKPGTEESSRHRYKAALAVIGVCMVLYSILAFDDTTPFPSLYTLVPVVGTCLIILYATPFCLTGKVLSLKPLVGIGLLSYSAYLWHQPVFALYRLSPLQLTAHDAFIFPLLIAAVFALAWVSWKYIEAPFRHKKRMSRARVFTWASTGIVVLLGIGGTLNRAFTPEVDPFATKIQDCTGHDMVGPALICQKIGTGSRLVILFGDSHVLPLINAFNEDPDRTYMFISIPGCPPLVGVERYDGIGNSSNCDKPGQLQAYASQVAHLQPEKIILVGRWTLYMHGWQKKNVLQKRHHLLHLETGETGLTPQQVVAAGLNATVTFFTRSTPASQLFILEQVPDIQMFGHVKTVISSVGDHVPRAAIDTWDQGEMLMLDKETRQGILKVIRTKLYFCNTTTCKIGQGKNTYYLDDNHLSASGSRLLSEPLKMAISD